MVDLTIPSELETLRRKVAAIVQSDVLSAEANATLDLACGSGALEARYSSRRQLCPASGWHNR